MRDKLNNAFRNPPTRGDGHGGAKKVADPMGPLPKAQGGSGLGHAYGGGLSIGERREHRETEKMTDEQRMAYTQQKWDRERAKATTGPAAQTSLREAFEDGERSSRNSVLRSGNAGQREMRNYDRGVIATQQADDPSGYNMYDLESANEGANPHGTVKG